MANDDLPVDHQYGQHPQNPRGHLSFGRSQEQVMAFRTVIETFAVAQLLEVVGTFRTKAKHRVGVRLETGSGPAP